METEIEIELGRERKEEEGGEEEKSQGPSADSPSRAHPQ
jgi:hypothetical protein